MLRTIILLAIASLLFFSCGSKREKGDKTMSCTLEAQAQDAATVEQISKALRERLINYGFAEDEIAIGVKGNRIEISLRNVDPGKDKDRLMMLLQASEGLEIWETYENAELLRQLIDADILLSADQKKDTVTPPAPAPAPQDTSLIGLARQKEAEKNKTEELPPYGKNVLLELLNPMYDQTNGPYPGPAVGSSRATDTAKVNAYLSDPRVRALFPHNTRFSWTAKPQQAATGNMYYQLIALKARDGKAAMSQIECSEVEVVENDVNGGQEISMKMTAGHAREWERLTEKNIGRALALVLDGSVHTYPVVQSKISGGNCQITGNFTKQEAEDIANLVRTKGLPAQVRIVEMKLE